MRKTIKKIAFGDTLLPQEFTLGLEEPQTEITVWLHGIDKPDDVTHRCSMVCAAPLTICIGFNSGQLPHGKQINHLSLKFCEREGQKRILGEIRLEFKTSILLENVDLALFKPKNSKNYCLPSTRLAMHYMLHAYQQWKKDNTNGIKMSFLERRAAMVIFISPHPIFLVSLGNKENGNIFPMNLLGGLGNDYFGFALRTERVAGKLVERAGYIALSSIPATQGALAYQLAHNHTKLSIDWEQLPFSTKTSIIFNIPVPDFALRIKELEIKAVHKIGSHNFFVAKLINDEKISNEPGFCSIHGFYQHWRLKEGKADINTSLAIDELSKRGRYRALDKSKRIN